MYDWLAATLAKEDATVVTANLRLARTLRANWGEQQLASAALAWKSPNVQVLTQWLHALYDAADNQAELPSRLNLQQSRILWERCVGREVDDAVIGIPGLARLSRDAWVRMNEWGLDPDECANAALGQDQRIFARAVRNYRAELDANHWIDDATLPAFVNRLLSAGNIAAPRSLTLCGFDRLTPQVEALLASLRSKNTAIEIREPASRRKNTLYRCATADAELRTAGAWARQELIADSSLRLGIVVIGLDKAAERSGRLLREGFVPGWQYGPRSRAAALNVSFGRSLAAYPAIHTALLAMSWQVGELMGSDVSLLLRSSFIGTGPAHGRSRLEILLRKWPDRHWSATRLRNALRGRDESQDAADWLRRLKSSCELQASHPDTASPSQWAGLFNDLLVAWNWPGDGTHNSDDHQLLNRWRELLNEFAAVQLVAPTMSKATAIKRLQSMASETLFQPESDAAVLDVLGPLEAAGMEFDKLWVAGLSADDWPPAGRPSPLIARELQITHALPDAEPQDTADYAARVLDRLRASANECCLSYASTAADQQQLPSALLSDLQASEALEDPQWHAGSLLGLTRMRVHSDPPPALLDGEKVSGGAHSINRQIAEPLTAFATGRLGISLLWPFTAGIPPNVRGNLVHDALSRLYSQFPAQRSIQAWDDAELAERIEKAVDAAFVISERHADPVLRQLFRLERSRTSTLLREVVAFDCEREPFGISNVEIEIEGRIGPLAISLRCDRIDELLDSSVVILDYKTGSRKRFLQSGKPTDMQLVVYACMSERDISGLGLYNVDKSFLGIDGAGPVWDGNADWQESLDRWKSDVLVAARQIAAGDVRINIVQAASDARPFALLSRVAELKRDA